MKISKKVILLLLSLAIAFPLLAGCNIVPEEYTKGVRLDSSYPEDDMPIIDDATIYYCDADDSSITIRYGTKEKLDDVVGFYKDHFEENQIVLGDESDKSTRYKAEGSYMDFLFELRITEPAEGYEQQLFGAIVKIEIEFLDDVIPTVPPETLNEKILGFWRLESVNDGTVTSNSYDFGVAILFLEDGTAQAYENFEFLDIANWQTSGETGIVLTFQDGSKQEIAISFEMRDGIEYLIWEDFLETREFFRDSSDGFSLYDSNIISADQQLISALVDVTWYYVYYSDANGETFTGATGYSIYYSDGTFEDLYNEALDYGTWRVSDGRLYCEYNDGTSSEWEISVAEDSGTNYLYFYADGTPEFWLYSDVEQQQTSDSPIADLTWYAYAYIRADGSYELYDTIDTFYFGADGSFTNNQASGVIKTGAWKLEGNTLYVDFEADSVYWEAEYGVEKGIKRLYLYDQSADSSGNYWVFTSPSLINGPVRLASNEQFNAAIVDVTWYSVNYIYADGTPEAVVESSVVFHPDGTLDEMYDSEPITGVWSYLDGTLHIDYSSTGESYDYLDSYIEYDPVSDSMMLYMGDYDPAYAGGHWIFTTYTP